MSEKRILTVAPKQPSPEKPKRQLPDAREAALVAAGMKPPKVRGRIEPYKNKAEVLGKYPAVDQVSRDRE